MKMKTKTKRVCSIWNAQKSKITADIKQRRQRRKGEMTASAEV